MPRDILGVDVARDRIDVFTLSTSERRWVGTTTAALARFAKTAHGRLVVLVASGGYERAVMAALTAAGVDFARVNPRQARDFARATGRLARIDRVEAEIVARMGRGLGLEPSPPVDAARAGLADLVSTITPEKSRAG